MAYLGSAKDFRSELDKHDTWCVELISVLDTGDLWSLIPCRFLVDGKEPSTMLVRAGTIMVCSPRNEVYKVDKGRILE